MSTYSAYLLAWSSVIARDVIACFRPTDFPEKTTIWITRIAAGIIGVFLLIFGLFYQIPDTAFQYLFITGAMYTAGALGCVSAGLYWRKANNVGAYTALVMGAVAPLGFLVLEKSRDLLPEQFLFITDVNIAGLLSFVLAATGMILGSLFTQASHPAKTITRAEVP